MESFKGQPMNLYIIKDVLYNFTPGMAVVAAESLERCREIFHEQFCMGWGSQKRLQDFDKAVANNMITVVNVVNQEEGVVSYVYGGD